MPRPDTTLPMGYVRIPPKVKLFVGLISGNTALLKDVRGYLEEQLENPVDFESDLVDFTHTRYYAEEMGKDLKRKFLGFERLVDAQTAHQTKLKTNETESRFSSSGKRALNIDPGYLDLSKVVLFSTKDYSHRIYAGQGIYAEATLFFQDGSFNPWPWTYPDYRTDAYRDIFNRIRAIYREGLRKPIPQE